MLEVMQFVFSSFWVWLGTAILLGIVSDGVTRLVALFATILRR